MEEAKKVKMESDRTEIKSKQTGVQSMESGVVSLADMFPHTTGKFRRFKTGILSTGSLRNKTSPLINTTRSFHSTEIRVSRPVFF